MVVFKGRNAAFGRFFAEELNGENMFLDRVSDQSFEGGVNASAPLIATKDSPRKAFFKKLNRHGAPSGRGRKIRRTGRMVRGNSFAGVGYAQRVVVKINLYPVRTSWTDNGILLR